MIHKYLKPIAEEDRIETENRNSTAEAEQNPGLDGTQTTISANTSHPRKLIRNEIAAHNRNKEKGDIHRVPAEQTQPRPQS